MENSNANANPTLTVTEQPSIGSPWIYVDGSTVRRMDAVNLPSVQVIPEAPISPLRQWFRKFKQPRRPEPQVQTIIVQAPPIRSNQESTMAPLVDIYREILALQSKVDLQSAAIAELLEAHRNTWYRRLGRWLASLVSG